MSPGLPGLGLGGIFFILAALLAPVVELVRTLRGESSAAAWRRAGRQFWLAVAMIAAIDLTLRAALLALSVAGLANPPQLGLVAMPLWPLGLTTALMCVVLAVAKVAELAQRWRGSRRRRRRIGRTATAESGS